MKKGRFANLDARLPADVPAAVQASTTDHAGKTARAPSREGKVGIMVWVREETRDQLKDLARAEKTSLNALVLEALDRLARSRSLHPFNEGEVRK